MTLYMMIGIPGSGKSTIAKDYSPYIVETDAIRKEICGDASCQEKNREVFKIAHERVLEHLNNNRNVVFDATNVLKKNRQYLLSSVPEGTKTVAVIVGTPLEICLERNAKRDRVVPDKTIEKMYLQMQSNLPKPGDGEFNSIINVREWA